MFLVRLISVGGYWYLAASIGNPWLETGIFCYLISFILLLTSYKYMFLHFMQH